MKEVVLRIPEIDYVLIHWPNNELTPWVAAWSYNEERKCWGQGHYFMTKENAINYLIEVLRERYPIYIESIIANLELQKGD